MTIAKRSGGGRPPRKPKTERGRAILKVIEATGLGMKGAAERAGVSYETIYKLIHDDPERSSVAVVEAVCRKLAIPVHVVAPSLAKLARQQADADLAASA